MYISLLETRDIFCFLPYHTYLKLILNRFFINYIDNHFLYRNAFLLAYVFWKTKFVTLVSISVWHIHSNLVLGYYSWSIPTLTLLLIAAVTDQSVK